MKIVFQMPIGTEEPNPFMNQTPWVEVKAWFPYDRFGSLAIAGTSDLQRVSLSQSLAGISKIGIWFPYNRSRS